MRAKVLTELCLRIYGSDSELDVCEQVMKYVFNILAVIFIGWPSVVAGYLWSAASSGWSTGCFLYQRHEDAAIRKFTKGDTP